MSDCNNCNVKKEYESNVEEKEYAPVPYWAFEEIEARHGIREQRTHREKICLMCILCAVVLAFIGYVAYQSQFETVETTEEISVDADNNGNANYFEQNGGEYYGTNNDSQTD